MTSTKQRGGVAIDGAPTPGRLRDLDQAITSGRGTDRGVLTALALEDLNIGTDTYFAVVDVGPQPFVLSGIAVQAKDAGAGNLTVALYRVDADELLPTRFTARLSAQQTFALAAGYAEVLTAFNVPKELDRIPAAWLVAVTGSAAGATVRGTSANTTPAFGGWHAALGAALPAIVDSRTLARTTSVISAALLTQTGLRLRSS